MTRTRKCAGFSLIELVIVVVIIGIIGAIAIPRMSRGAAGAADSALVADLTVLRNAIELYAAEHGGDYPTLALISDQLTKKTNAAGTVDDGTPNGFIYGPYVRKIPALPVSSSVSGAQGSSAITGVAGTASNGWVYDETTGDLVANSPDSDANGNPYNDANFY